MQARQVKKLVIKNFKGQRLPEDFETSSWSLLCTGIHEIFCGKDPTVGLELLYRTCENLCRSRMAHTLYSKLYSECETHIRSYTPRIIGLVESDLGGVKFLNGIKDIWKEYTQKVNTICNVFLFLDRVFVLNRPELVPVRDFCMKLFRVNVMSDCAVQNTIIPALLEAIHGDRQLDMSETGLLIQSITHMLSELNLMEEWANEAVAKDTSSFFSREANEKLSKLSIPEYLEHIRRLLSDEAARYRNYGFEARFSLGLLRRVQDGLFVNPLDEILTKGLAALIFDENETILQLLYNLANQTESLDRLRTHWSNFIKTTANSLVNDNGREEYILVGELIELKDRLDKILKHSFDDNLIFGDALKEAFESVMNSRQNRPAELIAKYADYQLRGGVTERTSLSDDQLDSIMDKIIVMFRFLQGKDIFESFFKKDLSLRLLLSRTISIEAEKKFVSRLKQECGSAFTSRLEGMFKDVEVSKDTMNAYRHSPLFEKSYTTSNSVNFRATVITSGLWPYPPLVSFKLPDSILREEEKFTEFYKAQHKGRVLTWHQGLGHCIIKAHFPLGTKELQVSINQALILVTFNNDNENSDSGNNDSGNNEEISYSTLQERTGLDDLTLVRTLQSLSCGKINILLKAPQGREISIHDKFSFNKEFTSKHHRIRVSGLSQREVSDEQIVNVIGEGSSDRHYQIDAAIVRVLKVHRKLETKDLLALASEQLSFNLSLVEFNKRIPTLIEREFISQDPENPKVYSYVI